MFKPRAPQYVVGEFVIFEPTRLDFAFTSTGSLDPAAKERQCLVSRVLDKETTVAPMTSAGSRKEKGVDVWFQKDDMYTVCWHPTLYVQGPRRPIPQPPDREGRAPIHVNIVEGRQDFSLYTPSYIWIGDMGETLPRGKFKRAKDIMLKSKALQLWTAAANAEKVIPKPTLPNIDESYHHRGMRGGKSL